MNDERIRLARAIDLFIGEQHNPTTAEAYSSVLRHMRDFVGPARPLETIRAEHLIEYSQAVRRRPTVRSDATYNKYIKTVRVFFNWCVKTEMLASSPAKSLKVIRRPRLIDREKAMSDADYEQLLDYAKWTARYHALTLFLGDTGCRIGGAAGLQWPQVDLDNKSATVTEKGQPPRPVFYGDVCRLALTRWQLQHTGRDGQYVFTKHGNRIKNNSLGQLFERICERAGIGRQGPHKLRHRKGHGLADQGTPPTVAAKILGHANPMTTLQSYYPQDWERAREAASKLHEQPADDPRIIADLRDKFGSG